MRLLLALPLLVAAAPGLVAFGQPQRVGRTVVTPLKVVEDSRCPMNARCIWAGRIVVRVAIRRGPVRLTRDLTLGEPVAGLVLDTAEPGRVAGTPADPHAYRFHFAAAPLSR